eukprot:TRINITY_DN17041_c0_g1_i1.p1 TRINITY_DN17041_c0_g1~~TRINITY_DN17041_c0_g1_i1.p1  ORF type:complete len:365 (+),score=39.43 TRINITY_DN17041_c0_g1_i1:54-1148(+)
MAAGNVDVARDAASYGLYPRTAMLGRVGGPPDMLFSEPQTEGYQSQQAASKTEEMDIPMPRFLGRGPQQPEPQAQVEVNRAGAQHEGGYQHYKDYYGMETNYQQVRQGLPSGHGDNYYPYYQDRGYGPTPAAGGRHDGLHHFWSHGSGPGSERSSLGSAPGALNGQGRFDDDYYQHRDRLQRGSLPMQQGYNRPENYNRNYYYQQGGYQQARSRESYSNDVYMKNYDRNEVPLNSGRSQDNRGDVSQRSMVSQKSRETVVSVGGSTKQSEASFGSNLAVSEEVSGSLTNAGAVWHAGGRCIPCKFFRSKSGCKGGLNCEFCHYPHQELSRSQLRSRFKQAHYKNGEANGASAASGAVPRATNAA